MWAVLGDIEFELLNHPTVFEERTSADYAEHALIQGKPRLEFVGEGLDDLFLELLFHATLVDPEAQIRRLKAAKAAHDPMPLVLGSGDFRGVYLITAVDTRTGRTDGQGRLIAAGVSVALREYTGDYNRPLPKPLALVSEGAALPAAQLGAAAVTATTPTQQLLSHATSVGNLLKAGLDTYRMAQSLRNNPAALLGQAGELMQLSQRVLSPLEGMQGAAALLANGAVLAQLGAATSADVQAAASSMNAPTLDAIVGQVDYAAQRMSRASSRMKDAAPQLAELAANVITRRA